MTERPFKLLIFDRDRDVLIALQHVLEDAGLDTTVTWDEAKTCNLVAGREFDAILTRDCPPGPIAENVRHDLRKKHLCPCMVLIASKAEAKYFLRLGFLTIDQRAPVTIPEQISQISVLRSCVELMGRRLVAAQPTLFFGELSCYKNAQILCAPHNFATCATAGCLCWKFGVRNNNLAILGSAMRVAAL